MPPGVLANVLPPQDWITAIVADPRIAGVTVTSGVAADSALASAAGAALKKSVLELGGSDPFIVLADVTADMTVARCETFGPVAAILAANDADHAIALADASDYGLSSAVWTGDPMRAKALAGRLTTGATFINGISASDPRVPIGGTRRSGYGRELGWFGSPQLVWTH